MAFDGSKITCSDQAIPINWLLFNSKDVCLHLLPFPWQLSQDFKYGVVSPSFSNNWLKMADWSDTSYPPINVEAFILLRNDNSSTVYSGFYIATLTLPHFPRRPQFHDKQNKKVFLFFLMSNLINIDIKSIAFVVLRSFRKSLSLEWLIKPFSLARFIFCQLTRWKCEKNMFVLSINY